jgi:hypothetical protein
MTPLRSIKLTNFRDVVDTKAANLLPNQSPSPLTAAQKAAIDRDFFAAENFRAGKLDQSAEPTDPRARAMLSAWKKAHPGRYK